MAMTEDEGGRKNGLAVMTARIQALDISFM
jgi:hypothetical protein